jgi:hypothetical protein
MAIRQNTLKKVDEIVADSKDAPEHPHKALDRLLGVIHAAGAFIKISIGMAGNITVYLLAGNNFKDGKYYFQRQLAGFNMQGDPTCCGNTHIGNFYGADMRAMTRELFEAFWSIPQYLDYRFVRRHALAILTVPKDSPGQGVLADFLETKAGGWTKYAEFNGNYNSPLRLLGLHSKGVCDGPMSPNKTSAGDYYGGWIADPWTNGTTFASQDLGELQKEAAAKQRSSARFSTDSFAQWANVGVRNTVR